MTNPDVSDRCSNRDDWSMPVKVGDNITVSKQSSNIRFAVAIINKNKWTLYDSGWVTNNSITITANNDGYLFLAFSYTSGNITPEEIVAAQFQAEWSSVVTAYEAYTETTATVTLGQTVYGGIVDFKVGKVTITDGYIASYNGETLPSTWISDRDVYAVGTNPTTGAEVVYKLVTPTEITVSPATLTLLKGYNYITGDGVITITALTGDAWGGE